VHADVIGQRSHLLVKSISPGDLEGDKAHLPRSARYRERALDPADLQDVDGAGTERDSPSHRDGMDQAAVDVMLAVDLDRREQARHGAGGQDGGHDRPGAEPPRARSLDAGRDAVEGQLEIGEIVPGKRVLQHVAQRLDRMQVRARAG
jgi:hypothetical protein